MDCFFCQWKILKCCRKDCVHFAKFLWFYDVNVLSEKNMYFFRIAFPSNLNCPKAHWKTLCGTSKNYACFIQPFSEEPLWIEFVCRTNAHKYSLILYDAMNVGPPAWQHLLATTLYPIKLIPALWTFWDQALANLWSY